MPEPELANPDIVERLRERCIRAAIEGYEDAGMAGLCVEGRWEAAISAIRRADLANLTRGRGQD